METQIRPKFKIIGIFLGKSIVDQKEFRCSFCGKLLMTFNGNIEHIHFDAPKADIGSSKDILCPRCKIIYRIINPMKDSI